MRRWISESLQWRDVNIHLQMHGMRIKVYFSNVWNWIEWASFATYFIGLALQHGPTIKCYEAARIFRSFNFMSFAYQLIRYMTALEMWGILIPVLHRMVSKIRIILLHFWPNSVIFIALPRTKLCKVQCWYSNSTELGYNNNNNNNSVTVLDIVIITPIIIKFPCAL